MKLFDYIIRSEGRLRHGIVAILLLSAVITADAATYVLPANVDVVGQLRYIQSKSSETLLDIARRYDLGFNAITAANPGVDPWLPGEGTPIVIPSRHILPRGPRKGIVINLAEKRLYYYAKPSDGPATVSIHPISIGPEGGSRLGNFKIAKRLRKPSWTVPASTRAKLRAKGIKVGNVVRPGRNNPLGRFAMKLDGGNYMLHGTDVPFSIGRKVERASIRLYPEDIDLLVHRVPTATPVRIVNQEFKYGYRNGTLYLELHKPEGEKGVLNHAALVNVMAKIVSQRMDNDEWTRVKHVAESAGAVAMPVAQLRQQPKHKKAWMLRLASFKTYASAHKLLLKLEATGMPIMIQGCSNGERCQVVAGPYRNWAYLDRNRKKVKWITRLKGTTVPYVEENDLANESGQQIVSMN